MPHERAGSYEVGYGKPPRHTQFRKGQSGNPRGGRSGAGSLSHSVRRAMGRKLSITENGRRRRISAQEAIVMAQVQKALKGDHRAAKWLVDLQQILPMPEPPTSTSDEQQSRRWKRLLSNLDVDTMMKLRMAMVKAQQEDDRGEEDG